MDFNGSRDGAFLMRVNLSSSAMATITPFFKRAADGFGPCPPKIPIK
jgi:hypothetical protein